jgi:PhzF family phenazine biosynthesis protein
MKKYIVYQIDSFTRTKFQGNPAGVVTNAAGLTTQDMQHIARELNNSETAFLFPSDGPDCDGVIRYFTPTTEVPTCGHATIAAMYAYALENALDSCLLKFKTQIGVLPFEIIKTESDYKIIMTQGAIQLEEPLAEQDCEILLKALGLTLNDLDSRCSIQIASTGHSKVMIGIQQRSKLNQLTPDLAQLTKLSAKIKCNGYFVFTFDTDQAGILTHGRMFAPAIGIAEDPVTGNANGPLGAYLVHHKLVHPTSGSFRFTGKQGEKMGRPGLIEVQVILKAGKPERVQIAGEAVVVFRTELDL